MHIIDDAYSLTQIKAKCKALAKQWCKAIYIDYLQLISMGQKSWDGNRNNEVSFLSRELKLLSKTIKCPLVVWSQLSRAVEGRANKRPILSDLRDSWSIEQDADTVIMLYRWDYYNTDEVPDGILDVLIRKHRSGDTKEIPMKFDWPTVKIRNQSDKSDNPF
jgi:replicative DNA helicase